VAEEKKRKPLIEAIISKVDGLDILAEISGEKKQEKKEVAPTDTLGGMLQTLPMLVMLPAVMPLIQQMMTQTLSSTTVNVKVESATTILPIEISASTAIVPIEIKASSVTLNVNITAATARVGINIQAQDVDIQLTEQFWAFKGKDKVITSVPTYVYSNETLVIDYRVPAGKRLIVYSILLSSLQIIYSVMSRYPIAGWWPTFSDCGDDMEVYIERNYTTVLMVLELKSGETKVYDFKTPLIFDAGQRVTVSCATRHGLGAVKVTLYAIEVEA
jgi:hypothetical protein